MGTADSSAVRACSSASPGPCTGSQADVRMSSLPSLNDANEFTIVVNKPSDQSRMLGLDLRQTDDDFVVNQVLENHLVDAWNKESLLDPGRKQEQVLPEDHIVDVND